MFTWICQKCGTEVPPSYSDCPNCAAGTAEEKPPVAEAAPAGTPVAPTPAATGPVAAKAAPAPAKRSSKSFVQAIVGALAVCAILAAIFVVVRSGALRRSAPPAAGGAASTSAIENAGAPQGDLVLKNIEVTGFRLSEEQNKKPMLRFVVVNHSAADVGEIKAKGGLRSKASAATDEPVATFEFTTRLGPYEAQDIRVPLETKLRAYELPDWQLLRADLTRQ